VSGAPLVSSITTTSHAHGAPSQRFATDGGSCRKQAALSYRRHRTYRRARPPGMCATARTRTTPRPASSTAEGITNGPRSWSEILKAESSSPRGSPSLPARRRPRVRERTGVGRMAHREPDKQRSIRQRVNRP